MDFLLLLTYLVIFSVFGYCLYSYFSGDSFQLKCIVSTVDGNKYCVRDRKRLQEAADLLAKVADKLEKLVEYIDKNHRDEPIAKRLKERFNKNAILETLPTSSLTAYSTNKGESISFCLNKKKEDNEDLIDFDTLFFVGLHETSHIFTESIGHKEDFWKNFALIQKYAKEGGFFTPPNYKDTPVEYCGMQINDNPFYDL